MNTFNLIIINLLHLENFNFFIHSVKNHNIDTSLQLTFNLVIKNNLNIKEKFNFLKTELQSFLIKNKEDLFIEYFYKIQKTYHALNRFAYICKYKKANIVVNTDIMGLNELNINDKNIFCLFHNNSKYLFLITDLIKIIDSSLTNSYMFFSEPKCIKNPYDNLPITKSNLYNIYFFIKYKTNFIPDLFCYFFKSNFNLNIFKIKYEVLLRDYIIENFVKKSTSNVLLNEIKKMIKFYNRECNIANRIHIDEEFPTNKLIKIFRPYLHLYCISKYGYLQHIKSSSLFILKRKLLEFNKFNPQFGRKRYKILTKFVGFKKKICGKLLEFNDNHIKFEEKNHDNYLSDHLNYNENYIMNSYYIIHDTNTFIVVDEQEDMGNSDDDTINSNSDNDTGYHNVDDIHNPSINTILRSDAHDELDDSHFNQNNNDENEENEEEDDEEEDEEDEEEDEEHENEDEDEENIINNEYDYDYNETDSVS